MGLGSSCYLMAPLALYARRFPPERFATLVGIQIGLGTLGTLLRDRAARLVGGDRSAGARPSVLIAGLMVAAGARWSRSWCRGRAAERTSGAARDLAREHRAALLQAMRTPSFGRSS